MTTKIEMKGPVPGVEATFTARIYLVNGPPDGDGDQILDNAVADGHEVAVSLGEHDVMTSEAEAAGKATLHHAAGAVVALGHTLLTPRGEALRRKLAANAGRQQWSIGYRIVNARGPTRAELAAHPDLKRIIVKWNPIEISPVTMGACGPACRTLTAEGAAKGLTCAGPCCDAGDVRAAALVELARFEHTRARLIFSEAKRRLDAIDADRRALEAGELRPSEIPDDVRAAAEDAVEVASKILRVSRPAIKWYDWPAALELGAKGMAWRGEGAVWIARRDDGDPDETYRSVLHEVAHVKGLDEQAARRFADRLSCLRGVEVRAGRRKDFEGYVEGFTFAGLAGTRRVPAVAVGSLVLDGRTLYQRVETDDREGWREVVTDLIPA